MKPLRDWNHNGKDDMFDHAMDYYVYKHVFEKDEPQKTSYKPPKKRDTYKVPDSFKRKKDYTIGELLVYIAVGIIVIIFFCTR